MAADRWVTFEGYEGRFDPNYSGSYIARGFRFPLIEDTHRWDIVRVVGEPTNNFYRASDFTVLSRGHDMMKKARDEFSGYRFHFKTCLGVGRCADIGHPGGPRRSMREGIGLIHGDLAEPPTVDDSPSDLAADDALASDLDPPGGRHDPEASPTATEDWQDCLGPTRIERRWVASDINLSVVHLRFPLWAGPFLSMAEDCNKRGGRVTGSDGELSCAEVEIVKRFRRAGWEAAWFQAFRCGRKTWSVYIRDAGEYPAIVARIQDVAGAGAGHPDVVAWTAGRVVFVESKGPGDSIKDNQKDWFRRALAASQSSSDFGLVEWTASSNGW